MSLKVPASLCWDRACLRNTQLALSPSCPSACALSRLFGVTPYLLLWEGLSGLPASTPSYWLATVTSCPPATPATTTKVTDDLLIARSDRHLGLFITVVLSLAFDGLAPPAWLLCWYQLLGSAAPCPADLSHGFLGLPSLSLPECPRLGLLSNCELSWAAVSTGPEVAPGPSVSPPDTPTPEQAHSPTYESDTWLGDPVRQVLWVHFTEE